MLTRKLLLLFSVTLLIYVSGLSQSVRVAGKITDTETGSGIAGATVRISSSTGSSAATTDVEGNFFATLQLHRRYRFSVSSIGYQEKQVTDSFSTVSDIPLLAISLSKSRKQLQDVVVQATVRREAQASLYSAQKNSSAISDGISAELIRRSPDKNTGDVLKRVSGASVQDNKFVVIRGLSERYNVSLLNNSVLPSTEADKKAFAFDIIPSSIVDNLVIYKTATPDLPGDFSGGAIKVFTKDFPARSINEVSVSFSYNSLTTGKNFYTGFPKGNLDGIGFFGNSRLIPGAYYNNRNGFILNSNDFKKSVTKLFPNTFGYEAGYRSIPGISVGFTSGNTRVMKSGKLGYIFSLNYGNARAVSVRDRNEYDIVKRNIYDYATNGYDEKNNLSVLLNLSYAYKRSKIAFKSIFNNNFVKTVGIRQGTNYENGPDNPFYLRSANSEASGNGLVNSVLEGTHKLSEHWALDWSGSFGYTYKNQPDQRILAFRSPENDKSSYYLRLSNENSPEIRNAGRVYSFLGEYIYGANLNATRQFQLGGQTQKLKFGTMNYYRDRAVEVDALGYASLSSFGVTIPESKTTTFNNLFSPANIDTYDLTVANIETNSTDYTGKAMMNAGYLMMDNRFSDKLKMTWGVRAERYHQELAARGKVKRTYDNTDFLPSLLLTYSVSNKTNLRLAGSQAVNRPEFRELADYSVFDYDNYVAVRGNPSLVRCRNTNADLRYEWFPAAGEIVSASLFYKYFDKPIEQTNKGNDVLSYENADHATAYGAEIELRKKLDFISGGFFRQLTFYVNAALIKGAVQFGGTNYNSPLQGQSPYLVNSGLSYTSPDDQFAINLLYNRIGPRLKFRAINGASLNIYERPRDVIDFQLSKKLIQKRLEVKLTVSDLLAQPFTWYYKYDVNPTNTNYKATDDKIINSTKLGTSVSLGLRYNFAKQ